MEAQRHQILLINLPKDLKKKKKQLSKGPQNTRISTVDLQPLSRFRLRTLKRNPAGEPIDQERSEVVSESQWALTSQNGLQGWCSGGAQAVRRAVVQTLRTTVTPCAYNGAELRSTLALTLAWCQSPSARFQNIGASVPAQASWPHWSRIQCCLLGS